jgi:micrococcal nuclease
MVAYRWERFARHHGHANRRWGQAALKGAAAGALTLVCLLSVASAGGTITVRVLSCHDGDTCRADAEILPGRDRVRLANADTPEIEGQCREEIERAIEARDYTRALVVGRAVTLTAVEPDKYDKRVDAYVRLPDGRDLGDALIAAGLASSYAGGRRDGWCD